MSERCDRCGSIGEDRRTLWMALACFYKMTELDVPFGEAAIHGTFCEKVGEETTPHGFASPRFADPTGDSRDHPFYTLRVCKRCRAEWMNAIREWFHAKPLGVDGDADVREPSTIRSGIYVRENGNTIEITREEWDRRCVAAGQPGREPVIWKGN